MDDKCTVRLSLLTDKEFVVAFRTFCPYQIYRCLKCVPLSAAILVSSNSSTSGTPSFAIFLFS